MSTAAVGTRAGPVGKRRTSKLFVGHVPTTLKISKAYSSSNFRETYTYVRHDTDSSDSHLQLMTIGAMARMSVVVERAGKVIVVDGLLPPILTWWGFL